MTVNEQIAREMGWDYTDEPFPFHDGEHFFDLNEWNAVKAMLAKMIDDGWEITINISKDRAWCEALQIDEGLYHVAGNNEVLTELAATVSLFCKVYGIADEA